MKKFKFWTVSHDTTELFHRKRSILNGTQFLETKFSLQTTEKEFLISIFQFVKF